MFKVIVFIITSLNYGYGRLTEPMKCTVKVSSPANTGHGKTMKTRETHNNGLACRKLLQKTLSWKQKKPCVMKEDRKTHLVFHSSTCCVH